MKTRSQRAFLKFELQKFAKNKRSAKCGPFIARLKSDVEKTANLMLHDHKDEVEHPNDAPAKQQAKNERHDFAFLKSGDCAANPRSERNDRENEAHDPAKTKII